MKKLILFLFALPLLALISCGDDNEPDVNIFMKYKNAVVSDDEVYVVKGDTLVVDSLWIEAVNKKHNASIVGPAGYYLGGVPIARTVIPPYRMKISTDNFAAGKYYLQVVMVIAEEDCALATGVAEVSFNVVNSTADIPLNSEAVPITQRRNK